jgi:hypothetical protein
MAALSVPTRLAYIGLWTLADDDGYFETERVRTGTDSSGTVSVFGSGSGSVLGLESGRGTARGLREAATETGGLVATFAKGRP